MLKSLKVFLSATTLAVTANAAAATSIFSDDFNDGDTSDWTITASSAIAATAGLSEESFGGDVVFVPFSPHHLAARLSVFRARAPSTPQRREATR